MKKLGIFLLFCFLLSSATEANAQIAQKHKVFIDGYYGYPNLIGTTLKNKVKNFTEVLNLDIGGNGPIGGKVEYMFHDKIGIAIDVNTSYSYAIFDGLDTLFLQRHYEINRKVLRILPRINFHMINHEHLDLYGGLGVGYNGSKWKFETDDPNFDDKEFKALIPVSFRFFFGSRYFFNDYIGLNLELGLGGGGLIQGGLSFRI